MFYKATLALSAALLATTAAYAQTAGSTIVSAAWLHLEPQSKSDPLQMVSPVNNTATGSGSKVASADTVGLIVNHFITDNISAEFVVGVPPKHNIEGAGTLERFGKLGSVKQWSPAIVAKYYFGDATTRFRPYIGAGINYTWYSDAQITNEQFAQLGLRTASASNTSVSAKASWNPVFTIGANYAINQRWYAGAFISYLPLKTTATITTTNANLPGIGLTTTTSEAHIRIRPIVSSINVGYRF